MRLGIWKKTHTHTHFGDVDFFWFIYRFLLILDLLRWLEKNDK